MPENEKGNRELPRTEKNDKAAQTLEEETLQNVNRIVDIERSQRNARTRGERIAEFVARFCGSMTFVWVHIVWFASWIIVNSLIANFAFDPFPFTFLTLVVSLEAIFLSTFILISQNHETQLTERRNHLDLQINLLTEQENTKMLQLLMAISEKVGVSINDPAMEKLTEPVDPQVLVEQIMTNTVDEAKPKNETFTGDGPQG